MKSGYCLENVDHWHEAWPEVLKLLDTLGHTRRILVDKDGWLSARQCVVGAFDPAGRAVGQMCFHIEPISIDGKMLVEAGKVVMRARLDCHGVAPGLNEAELTGALREASEHHARSLGCRGFVTSE